MKKILYYIHVPWNWAKQRPHFIAEYLSGEFKVDVFQEKAYNFKNLSKNPISENTAIHYLNRIPYDRNRLISDINCYLIKNQLKELIRNYDIIWLAHPLLYKRIKDIIPVGTKVVYDCMDDHIEFPVIKNNPVRKAEIEALENELIKRANLVFCSSDFLKNKLLSRYGNKLKIITVNNSIHLNVGTGPEPEIQGKSTSDLLGSINKETSPFKYIVSYVGTISTWLDFEPVLRSVSRFSELVFLFFGPSEIEIPTHRQIKYFGPVPHNNVNDVLALSDALIMPFQLSELILSVDPVKLYEYIYQCKPVIAIRYGETEKFSDYVYLYNDNDEFVKYMEMLCNGTLILKNTEQEHKTFAENNTWEKRTALIADCLNKL